MPRSPRLLLLALGLSAGCAAVPHGGGRTLLEEHLAVPVTTAALATAAAARAALPCADPSPWHAGAPLRARAGGGFAIRYECDGTATVPVGDHRILPARTPRLVAATGLPGNGGHAVLDLELVPTAAGATLRGHLDRDLAQRFRKELARALALAPPVADERADPIDDRIRREHAALGTADPTFRATLLASAPTRGSSPRVAAWRCLQEGDLTAARVLLHSAWRQTPHPAADYELAAALHARDADPMGAFAFRLLAREHVREETAPLAGAPPR